MISIFSPVHPPSSRFLGEAWKSLQEQTVQDFQWVLLLNGGLKPTDPRIPKDPRVKVAITQDDHGVSHNKIGRLKYVACNLCDGDILLELDADDILLPTCLAEVAKAFEKPEVMFVYSNTVGFREDWKPHYYSPHWGWINRPFQYQDKQLVESVAWPPTAHSFRRIEFAPNHPRAWRRSAYEELGGHDQSLISGDDHDLCCRTYIKYGAAGCFHLDKPTYLQRCHKSTSVEFNEAVQRQVGLNYIKFIYPLAERWCDDQKLMKIDLGGAINPKPGYRIADLNSKPSVNLEKKFPWATNSVGIFRCSHTIEHLSSPTHLMEECYRCLAPGGWVFLEYPFSPGAGSFRDPSHKSFLNDQTIRYWTDSNYAKFISFRGRFQCARVEVWDMEPGVPVVSSELIAIKDGMPRRAGEILI